MQVLIFPHQILQDVLENSVSISLGNDIKMRLKVMISSDKDKTQK